MPVQTRVSQNVSKRVAQGSAFHSLVFGDSFSHLLRSASVVCTSASAEVFIPRSPGPCAAARGGWQCAPPEHRSAGRSLVLELNRACDGAVYLLQDSVDVGTGASVFKF